MDSITSAKVSAIVEYNYIAKESDELDLLKGEIINNIKIQAGGWWEGTLVSNGKTGMFPDNFVRVLESNDKSCVSLREKSATRNRKCKVIYSYSQYNEDELSLAVGNIIEVHGEVEEGWWRGKLGDKIGVFPSNFVIPIDSSPISAENRTELKNNECGDSCNSSEELICNSISIADDALPLLPPKPTREFCRVIYPYEPRNEDELELHVGEIISIVTQDLPDKGWWKGELRGKIGVFPDNFVSILSNEVSSFKDVLRQEYHHQESSKIYNKKTDELEILNSPDSLNVVLNKTDLISGNVALQRKSLEKKNCNEIKTHTNILKKHLEINTSDASKNLQIIDDKRVPPPVLTKKPVVPIKKSTVTSVSDNLLPTFKQKVKNIDFKTFVHDNVDGIGNSTLNADRVEDFRKSSAVEMFSKNEFEFDNVERNSILPDMRAGRVKAPKRRPPSANLISENNNNSIYLNGEFYEDDININNRTNFKEGIIPKFRDWENKIAPWMEELKANQAKKMLPIVEPRQINRLKPEMEAGFKNNQKLETAQPSKISAQNQSSNEAGTNCELKDNCENTDTSICKFTNSSKIENEGGTNNIEEITNRPHSLTIRNRSAFPMQQKHKEKCILSENTESTNNPENLCDRVIDLEQRVTNLEEMLNLQNRMIDDLRYSLGLESQKVLGLKSELDKYAQCVTQV